jgi:hypothetical protein
MAILYHWLHRLCQAAMLHYNNCLSLLQNPSSDSRTGIVITDELFSTVFKAA